MTAIAGFALALSVLGYTAFFHRRIGLSVAFGPLLSLAALAVCAYVFGVAGFLTVGCWAALALGWGLLARFWDGEAVKRILLHPSVVLTLCGGVWLYIVTRGVPLTHWDDATFWYRICRMMDAEGAFPTQPDMNFYTYVPGCATLNYLVTRMIGFSFPNCLFAQGLVSVASVAALLCALERYGGGRAALTALIAVFGLRLMSVAPSVYVLLVDSQVGMIAAAAVILALEADGLEEAIVPSCVLLPFLVLVKSSGWFFLLVALAVLVWRFGRGAKRRLVAICAPACVAAALFGAYLIRARLVYGSLGRASQGLSLRRFVQLFGEKSPKAVSDICGAFAQKFCGFGENSVATLYLVLLAIALAALVSALSGHRRMAKRAAVLAAAGALCAAAYALILLGTYLVSMSEAEALSVTCFERYFGAFVIALTGVSLYLILAGGGSLRHGKAFAVAAIAVFALCVRGWFPMGYVAGFDRYAPKKPYTGQFWTALESAIPENERYNEGRYVLLWNPGEFGGYLDNEFRLYEMAVLRLRSTDIWVISKNVLESLSGEELERMAGYDYLCSISDVSDKGDFLREHFGITDFATGVAEMAK